MSSIQIDESINLDINKPKKRGRKPKKKLLENEEVKEVKVPKKRGRKPKKKVEGENEIVKIPKKRGRKPNILYNNVSNNKNVFDSVIPKDNVLHLKMNSNDVDDYVIMDNIYNYNPEITEPQPYDPSNIQMTSQQMEIPSNNINNINNELYDLNNNTNEIVNNNNTNEVVNNINEVVGNNIKPLNDFYNNTNVNNFIDGNDKNNEIKMEKIEEKITEINIESNKSCKKKVIRPILKYYNEYNMKKEWPMSSNMNCFWCFHNFDNIPCALPIKINNNIFYVFGNFCSKECASAYNFDSNDTENVIWERYSLLNYLYSIINNDNDLKIKLAPPRLALTAFGGYLSINEFRESFDLNKNYKVIFPPMIPIIPSIEENNKDILKKKGSFYVPIDKERIKQVNNDLRLKRKKPITNKNTLENCMRLKYN